MRVRDPFLRPALVLLLVLVSTAGSALVVQAQPDSPPDADSADASDSAALEADEESSVETDDSIEVEDSLPADESAQPADGVDGGELGDDGDFGGEEVDLEADSGFDEAVFDIEDIALEDLLTGPVAAATRTEQRVEDAPAVVTVVTREEIQRGGYRTVAAALEMIPGFAVNTDHVLFNAGLRGISGGIRGGSRHLKVLVDGVPVSFLPDAWNFLGPEFLPISAVERIEVVRGPASALYGSNAFLGVVNVVTRDPGSLGGHGSASVELGAGSPSNFTGGGELLLSANEERFDLLVAGRLVSADRSGLTLPDSSPSLSLYDDPRSRSDRSEPLSLFGRLGIDLGPAGKLRLVSGYQRLDADGQYLDTGALSNDTHVQLDNYYGRLTHDFQHDFLTLNTYLGLAGGGPGDDDAILPVVEGRPVGQLVRRDFGYRAINMGIASTVEFSKSRVSLGFEYQHDREDIRTNRFVSRGTGATLSGPGFGSIDFDEYGFYAQVLINEIDRLSFSGNLRFDSNNQFGENFNYRAGAVASITDELYVKALSGSSFRGPTPEQFYATPMRPGGIQGSRSAADPFGLSPQRAFTHELVAGYRTSNVSATLNGYLTDISDRIEYLLRDGNLQVGNLSDSRTIGVEAEFRWREPDLFEVLDLTLLIQGSYQSTSFDTQGTATPREEELLELNELFPNWTLTWMINADVPKYHFNVNVRMPMLGERFQSQTNQLSNRPFVDAPLFTIPSSLPVHLTFSSTGLHILGDLETHLRLAIYDLFNSASEDPGFNGINVPALGRRFFFTVTQELR